MFAGFNWFYPTGFGVVTGVIWKTLNLNVHDIEILAHDFVTIKMHYFCSARPNQNLKQWFAPKLITKIGLHYSPTNTKFYGTPTWHKEFQFGRGYSQWIRNTSQVQYRWIRNMASQHLRTFESVLVRCSLFTGTVPVRCSLFAGTVPVRCFLFTGTVPADNLFLKICRPA